MKRKKLRGCNHIMLAAKLIVILLLGVIAIWTTDSIHYSVSSQNSNQPTKENDMTVKEKVQVLIQILQDRNLRETSPEEVVKAIQQIGKLKSANVISAPDVISDSGAVPALIGLLDFKKVIEKSSNSDVISSLRLVTLEETYPVIETLFLIGKPALPYLAKIIEENEPESTKSENALITISYIFREDLSKGIEFLEQAKNSTTTEGKTRFDKSIEKIKMKLSGSKN